MPAYNTLNPAALYPGTPIPLVGPTDSGVTTSQQCALPSSPNGSGLTVMILNSTTEDAQGEYAPADVDANYMPLSGCIVPAGSVLAYNLASGWIRFTFAVAPTSGSLIVSR